MNSYIAIDLETTGVSTDKDRVIEFAAVLVNDSQVVGEQQFLINPGRRKISPSAIAVHGIHHHAVKDAPHFSDIGWDIFEILDDTKPVLTYNGDRFDLALLAAEFDRHEIPIPAYVNTIDVYTMAKDRLALGSYKMTAVAEALNIRIHVSHRALEDARTLVAIYERLKLKPLLNAAPPDIDPSKYALQVRHHADILASASPEAAVALQKLSPHIVKLHAACDRASQLDCETEQEYQKTVQAEIFLKKLTKTLTKIRTDHLRALKATIKEIEKQWRDLALNPIKDALEHIELVRQPYLHLQHLRKQEALKEAQAKAARIAEEEAAKHYDAGASNGSVNAYKDIVRHEVETRLTESIEQVNKTVTKLGSGSVKTSYEIEIINPNQVPKYLWSPDEKLILAEANKYPDRNIPGVVVKPVFKHQTRAKR